MRAFYLSRIKEVEVDALGLVNLAPRELSGDGCVMERADDPG